MRWPRDGRKRAPDSVAVQAAVFPGAMSRRPLGRPPLIAGRPKRWVKNCHPTGVAVEQTSNIARGTPGNPAESRSTFTMLQDRKVL